VDDDKMKGLSLAILGALIVAILIMCFVYFLDVILGLTIFIGIGIIIGLVLLGFFVFIVMFIALFYYLAVKKSMVEPGEYKLEEVKGKK
jgi:hypothetical protein